MPGGSFSFCRFAYIPYLKPVFRRKRQRGSHPWSSSTRIYNLGDSMLSESGLRIREPDVPLFFTIADAHLWTCTVELRKRRGGQVHEELLIERDGVGACAWNSGSRERDSGHVFWRGSGIRRGHAPACTSNSGWSPG